MYKGIIFDLDGTLLDTIGDLTEAVNRLRKDYGLPAFTKEDVMARVGSGFRVLVSLSLPHLNEEETDKALEIFQRHYSNCYMDSSIPYEGISELVNELNKKGVKMAVNSNKKDSYTKDLIRQNFPGIEFTSVYGQRENVPKKPDPSTNYEIIEMMNLKKDEILYAGDSQQDMKTALNTGLKAIGVSWGFRSVEQLREAGADIIVHKPEEILALFK